MFHSKNAIQRCINYLNLKKKFFFAAASSIKNRPVPSPPKISLETKVDTISKVDLPVRQT